jgi:hypothetical protein
MGYLVPDEKLELGPNVSGNHVWFLQSFKDDLARGEDVVRDRLLVLRDKVTGERGGIILSAENMSDGFGHERLFASLQNELDIRIIIYVRRQDDFLLSSWQQWHVKRAQDFWTWILRAIAVQKRGDWLHALQPWIHTFGVESITVRRFGRQYFLRNDLVTDFCAAAGLDTSRLDLEIERENAGVGDAAMAFAFALQDLFESPHDNAFYQMIRRWGGEAAQKSVDSSLLSLSQRNAVLCHYADSNRSIKALFFAGENIPDTLFDPPRRQASEPARQTGIDPHSELLMRLIYGLYKELGELHRFENAVETLRQKIPGLD